MKENWIQLIDRIENDPFEPDAFVTLMEQVGEASDEDKREVVQEAERRIKRIARYDPDQTFRFRKFSELERDALESLWSIRAKILNVMMLNPTEEEIIRLGHQNDKLRELSRDAFVQGRNLWKSLLYSPILMANEDYYDVDEHVDFCYNDEDSVLKMENDAYYGSDFEYMLHFHCNFLSSGLLSMGEPLVEDDGINWNLDYLDNPAFDKFSICHLLHSLHSHEHYSLPDIIRMDDFCVHVWLQYEREVYQWKPGNVFFKQEENGKGMDETN